MSRLPPLPTYSREDDTTLVCCMECNWMGQLGECYHSYEVDSTGQEVDPASYCPECSSDQIEEV